MRKHLKYVITALLLLMPVHYEKARSADGFAKEKDSTLIMFWNLENFFDFKYDGTSGSDKEFSSGGTRRWSKGRFYSKCNAVAKTILWIGDKYGRLPDVIGFAEVENSYVMKSIVNSTALRKAGYGYIHFDSPDPRGIDVSMIYRKEIFEEVSAKSCRTLDLQGNRMDTRDILCTVLKNKNGGRLTAFNINHHPSKFSGAAASQVWREAAMNSLLSICDSLIIKYGLIDIVSMGDFNDTPDNMLFEMFEDKGMKNLAKPVAEKGEGTIRFAGKWELIDMFIVYGRYESTHVMEIVYPPFLMTEDKSHGGMKPLRTYSGPKYEGGVSDHCPVVLRPI